MIRAVIRSMDPEIREAVGEVVLYRRRITVRCRDRTMKERLELFYGLPAVEFDRSLLSVLRTIVAVPGSAEHFVSRSDRLHTLGLRAFLDEVR